MRRALGHDRDVLDQVDEAAGLVEGCAGVGVVDPEARDSLLHAQMADAAALPDAPEANQRVDGDVAQAAALEVGLDPGGRGLVGLGGQGVACVAVDAGVRVCGGLRGVLALSRRCEGHHADGDSSRGCGSGHPTN